jgi:hypothetical protein
MDMKIEDWAQILKDNFHEDWEMFGLFLVDEEGLNPISVRWIIINRKIPRHDKDKDCWVWDAERLIRNKHFVLYPTLWNQLDKFDYEFSGYSSEDFYCVNGGLAEYVNFKRYKSLSQAMRSLSAAVLYYIELGAKLF